MKPIHIMLGHLVHSFLFWAVVRSLLLSAGFQTLLFERMLPCKNSQNHAAKMHPTSFPSTWFYFALLCCLFKTGEDIPTQVLIAQRHVQTCETNCVDGCKCVLEACCEFPSGVSRTLPQKTEDKVQVSFACRVNTYTTSRLRVNYLCIFLLIAVDKLEFYMYVFLIYVCLQKHCL